MASLIQIKAKDFIGKPLLFEGLSEDSLESLLKYSVQHDFEAGRLLVQQGDVPSHLYIVIGGAIRTIRTGDDGREATIRMLQTGDTCMEAVLFMGGQSPIAVQCVEDSKLLMIPAAIVKSHVFKDGQFATNMLRIVTKHYKNAMHQIDGMMTKTPVQRLGYYFLKLHLEQGSESLDVALPFKKAMIANHLGMTPETFSRALSQLRKSGSDIQGDTITLRDAYALCQFCDADTAFFCPRHGSDDCAVCDTKH